MGLVKFLDLYNDIGSSGYDFSNSSVSEGDILAVFGAIMAAIGFFLVIIAIFAILVLIAKWKLFKKMGIEGWKSLINTVSTYLQMEATGVDQRWFMVFLILGLTVMIPVVNFLTGLAIIVAAIYFWILLNVSLARSFGKETGFAIGLILLYPIFLLILAFGSSEYVGPTPMNDILFSNKNNKTSAPAKEKSGKFCSNCGTKVNDDSKFCPNCGKEVK